MCGFQRNFWEHARLVGNIFYTTVSKMEQTLSVASSILLGDGEIRITVNADPALGRLFSGILAALQIRRLIANKESLPATSKRYNIRVHSGVVIVGLGLYSYCRAPSFSIPGPSCSAGAFFNSRPGGARSFLLLWVRRRKSGPCGFRSPRGE